MYFDYDFEYFLRFNYCLDFQTRKGCYSLRNYNESLLLSFNKVFVVGSKPVLNFGKTTKDNYNKAIALCKKIYEEEEGEELFNETSEDLCF